MQAEVISYNGVLMYRHPVLETLVPAPDGMKLGQRIEIFVEGNPPFFSGREKTDWDKAELVIEEKIPMMISDQFLKQHYQDELPLNWEDRPKL